MVFIDMAVANSESSNFRPHANKLVSLIKGKGEPLADRTYNHLAFKIGDADYDSRLGRIQIAGARRPRGPVTSRRRGALDLFPRPRQPPVRATHADTCRATGAVFARVLLQRITGAPVA